MPYEFVCGGSPPHISHSAAMEPDDPTCPECGAATRRRLEPDHDLTPQQLFDLSQEIKSRGYTEKAVAQILRLDVTELRMLIHLELHNVLTETRQKAVALKEEGNTALEIAKVLGLNESSVRAILDPNRAERRA